MEKRKKKKRRWYKSSMGLRFYWEVLSDICSMVERGRRREREREREGERERGRGRYLGSLESCAFDWV